MGDHSVELQAIETRYNGFRFRSRTEARWAIYFDALGIKYDYECEGYVLPNGEWYLPDFYLPQYGCHVEIKHLDGEFDKALSFAEQSDILMLDGPPDQRAYRLSYWFLDDDGERKIDTTPVCLCQYAIKKWGYGVFFYGPWAWGNNESYDAILAARSARFEHGETA